MGNKEKREWKNVGGRREARTRTSALRTYAPKELLSLPQKDGNRLGVADSTAPA
jgi:hypothetical protein